jgi:hypothetical protein
MYMGSADSEMWIVQRRNPEQCPGMIPGGITDNRPTAYPNPASGDRVRLALPFREAVSEVTVEAFDTAFRPVRTWTFGNVTTDEGGVFLTGIKGLAQGVYLLRVQVKLASGGTMPAMGLGRLVVKR